MRCGFERVTFHNIFEPLVLQEAERRCPECSLGRPRQLDDARVLAPIFNRLRTGASAGDDPIKLRRARSYSMRGLSEYEHAVLSEQLAELRHGHSPSIRQSSL